jgi:hexosaminidase
MKHKSMKYGALFVLCVSLSFMPYCMAKKNPPRSSSSPLLMPWPSQVTVEPGSLPLDSGFGVVWKGRQEPRLERAVDRFGQQFKELTGVIFFSEAERHKDAIVLEINCKGAGEDVQSIKELESYTLRVSSAGVALSAPTPVGVLRSLATLFQLIDIDDSGPFLPVVRIQDEPRFPWRGLLIDVCRHWMPIEVIKRNLDGMAAVKLNVLHWHLSEDQGFRVECKSFPKLHELGSDGLFYTQEQVREIVDYARDRGIRIVPEFDMPGHTTSWFLGYPELSSSPGPFELGRTWGIQEPCMDPTREETYAFLDTFIGEMAALFPDAYFHIGGDEVNGISWDKNPDIDVFKKQNGMKGNHDLQAYFNRRILAIVQKHGKKMIGWDEIFHPELPRDVVVQSWRGPDSLAQTAREGYMGILSNGYYLDYILSAAEHYAVDPHSGEAAQLSQEEKERILGGEACMWSEFVTPETIDSRVWPRTAAIAERFWSPQNIVDVEDMYLRLESLDPKLDVFGLKHRSNPPLMLKRLTGEYPVDALKTLAEIVEPVKEYTRPRTRAYTQMMPLDRLVDAARPESHRGRKFENLVSHFLDDVPGNKTDEDKIREQLAGWRDNHDVLKPILENSPLLEEIIPLSREVAALADTGLQAMDYIQNGQEAPFPWLERAVSLLDRPDKPEYELVVKIAPAIQDLVYTARLPLAAYDFEDEDVQGWEPNIPENWFVGLESRTHCYQLLKPGIQGKVLAPTSWSVLKDFDVSSFVFSGRLLCKAKRDNPHRDMVVIFHYQDPTHFYYVHFSASSDRNHNIIGLVDGKDRVKINLESPGESPARLTDLRFHEFKVTCSAGTGEIKAYLDDMKAPILTAKDTTLGHGLVGVGSFDDTGCFDDIILWGDREM